MSIFRGFLLASAVACASGAALASTVAIPVVVEEEQFFLEDGQNLTYTFSGLPRTIGSGGELLIIGDSLNQTSPPGLDITDGNEFFTIRLDGELVRLDGVIPDFFSCGDNFFTQPQVFVISGTRNCRFELTVPIRGEDLDRFLQDGVLSVFLNFSGTVDGRPQDEDFVRVRLSYETDVAVVPLPAGGLLLGSGLVLAAAVARRRRRGA